MSGIDLIQTAMIPTDLEHACFLVHFVHPYATGTLAASNGNLWRMPQVPGIPRKFGSRAFAKSQ